MTLILEVTNPPIELECKYWRPKKNSQPQTFYVAVEEDLDWLRANIQLGNLSNRAFIVLWPTFNSWSENLALGSKNNKNLLSSSKMDLLPFVNYNQSTLQKNTAKTNYRTNIGVFNYKGVNIEWKLWGTKNDDWNVAIYSS